MFDINELYATTRVMEAYYKAIDENDFSALATVIREEPEILKHAEFVNIYELIANKVDGTHKAKRGAKKQKDTKERYKIAERQCRLLTDEMGWSKEAAVAEIARRQGKSRKQVYEWLDKASKFSDTKDHFDRVTDSNYKKERAKIIINECLEEFLSQ